MALIQIVFSSAATADQLMAGLPTAARAIRNLVERQLAQPGDRLCVTISDVGRLKQRTKSEISRLAPDLSVAYEACYPDAPNLRLEGEGLALGEVLELPNASDGTKEPISGRSPAEWQRARRKASKAILKATGKKSDGVVSRFINRPISRFMSDLVLRVPGVTPIHGTLAALIVGVAMTGFLFFGGSGGVVIGAILFQFASVIDGVDGEIARATYRSSKSGAALDTACDAATNLAFLSGLTFNLWQQGNTGAASVGLVGLGLLAFGLFLLGWRSLAAGDGLTFDAVKNEFSARPSRMQKVLASITSRDVYALAFALMAAFGLAAQALVLFTIAVCVWLLVIIGVLVRTKPALRGKAG
ncbi:MAG: CDP-alcohol phosphatidyltransferase family protein [Pseudomonadota bacterium]